MFNRKKVTKLEKEVSELKYEVKQRDKLVENNKSLYEANIKLTSDLNDKTKLVREQTEADIYLTCKKLIKQIENGDKIKELYPQVEYMNALQERLREQQMMCSSVSVAQSGGLFPSGLFARY